MKKKKPHGGARPGAGRKEGVRYKEETKVIRVPVSKIEEIKALLKK